jgi:geranyl-CoA carboxylase beta subunit
MPIIESWIDRNSADFQANRRDAGTDGGERHQAESAGQVDEEKPKFDQTRQMLPHERVQHLLDARLTVYRTVRTGRLS